MSRLDSSKMDIQHMRAVLYFIGLLMLITGFSNGQSVTVTGPSAIERGSNAVYTCTGGAAPYIFTWIDLSVNLNIIFSNGVATYGPGETKYLNFGVTEIEGTSTLTIMNTQLEDEGRYRCSEGAESDEAELIVEVGPSITLETSTKKTEAGYFTTEETTAENTKVGPSITLETSTKKPEAGYFTTEETTAENTKVGSSITLETPTKKPDGYFTTEETTAENTKAGYFTTEETTAENTKAGYFTTEETTTDTSEAGPVTTKETTPGTTAETTTGTTGELSPVPCTCNGLSSGSAVGIAVLAILLAVSLIINVIQFIVWRRQETRSGFEASKKPVPREKRYVSHEANENMAYEMIQTGDSAYTALKLGPSHSSIIAPENVAFFTRLGSIGRGDFGEVWKGEFRSNQSRADVAIRQIPDQVTKSTNVLEAVKVLSELADQPNVVTCLGYCQEQGSILYEYISGGTLLTHLQTTGVQPQPTYSNLTPKSVRLDEGSLLNLAWQIAKGMQFLGSKKIIHGTLCAHNVLLADGRQCKLSDYGLSSSLFSDKSKPTRWSSPESMGTGDQSTYGDIWSFGIVLWEIVTLGARPYPNMNFDTVQTEVANGYQMPRPRRCGQEVYTVMSGCWEKEATNRSNFDQTLTSLERILEKNHNYLSLNDLEEGLFASTLDM